ncbi:GNAT family N-acetyltransferase [Lacrimispora sp.]|uniref:GNAT family N-acetyltransferase n=1 Tax=Lacrimispora sp. TaxID=2719234 RepID=UPI0028A5DF39|nr:GNAT family N-acetyltransferase [Lacrimispora sp.]
MREYFIKTNRIGFSKWSASDLDLAAQLWGDKEVTQFICAAGKFTHQDIIDRLDTEIHNDEVFHIQYWPVFELATDELIGCCGIRPFKTDPHSYELGSHLRKKYWGMGYASEAARAVINYSFDILKADKLYAGHHPQNKASEKLLLRLGFQYIGLNFYEPTGLYHPSYEYETSALIKD